MAGAEMASLKNPGLAGDVQFDTVIYGAPPLTYPASLSMRSMIRRIHVRHSQIKTFRIRRPWE